MIHPRIARVAMDEYLDGHYDSAAKKSLVEVEGKLRELFRALKPGEPVPSKVGSLITALLGEGGAYHFCDTSEQSGKDYHQGVQLLFRGAFSAYRNPASHVNVPLGKAEAFARIVLAGQLMSVLEPLG